MSNEGYAKLSNNLHRNEKMIVFGERHPRAFVIWTMAISASSDNQTDGYVSEMEAKRFLGAKKKDIDALETEGLWEKTSGGWMIHDYLELQNSSDDIAKSRADNAKRQAEWRKNHKTKTSGSNDSDENVTRYVTDESQRYVTGEPNALVTEQKKLKEKENKTKERVKRDFPSSDFDWRVELDAWEPKPRHYELSRTQAEKGYARVDVHDLAAEFVRSVKAKANAYGYVDFDEAFSNWLEKRSKDQKPLDPALKSKTTGGREVSEAQIQEVLAPIELSYPDIDYVTRRRAVVDALKQTRSSNTAAQIAGAMLDQAWVEVGS